MTRLHYLLDLIKSILGQFSPITRIMEHYIDAKIGAEYVNIRVTISEPDTVLIIRQYWRGGTLVAYGYYVRIGGYEEWWDNRPHHPGVQTFPHHQHVKGKVYPLQDYSLKAFLTRVKELLSGGRSKKFY